MILPVLIQVKSESGELTFKEETFFIYLLIVIYQI